jgi:DNA-binding NarL/FixJ family response regulator
MAEGHTNAAIAQRLFITEKAVVRHASHVYEALGIPPDPSGHRRVIAVVRYLSA